MVFRTLLIYQKGRARRMVYIGLCVANLLSLWLLAACESSTLPDNAEARSQDDVSVGSSLFSDSAERKLSRERTLARELAKTIEELSGIASARVHLILAAHSVLERGAPQASRAAIMVRYEPGKKVDEQTIRDLACAAITGLEPSNVHIFAGRPVPTPPHTVYVGPIEVVSSSARIARICLGGLLLLSFGLAVGLIGAGIKIRRFKNR